MIKDPNSAAAGALPLWSPAGPIPSAQHWMEMYYLQRQLSEEPSAGVSLVADLTGSTLSYNASLQAHGDKVIAILSGSQQMENYVVHLCPTAEFKTSCKFRVLEKQDFTPRAQPPDIATGAETELSRALGKFEAVVRDITTHRTVQVSHGLRTLAKVALAALPQRQADNVVAWAQRLAQDVGNADD
jgi:hypothetical protein